MLNPLVYIAGPYTKPDPIINTRKAVVAGMGIYEATGAGVVIPHLSLLAHAMMPRGIDYWYAFDEALIDHCTHMYRLDGESTGADREVRRALGIGIKIYYQCPEANIDVISRYNDELPPGLDELIAELNV